MRNDGTGDGAPTGEAGTRGGPTRRGGFRARLGDVIFETDTPLARGFDAAVLAAIVASVVLVSLESVASVRARWGGTLQALEWTFTVVFTIEYAARLWTAEKPLRYARSFYGIIDLLAIVPTYVSLLLVGSQYLVVVRALRLLRVFRVFKASRYLGEASVLMRALRASREKITVFLVTVLTVVLVIGSVMYIVEGPAHGFDSIPVSIYWAIVTLTTVGYGDIAPGTALGKTLSALVMVLGYGIIAVPTGIVTTEISRASAASRTLSLRCPSCGAGDHATDAVHCRICGEALPAPGERAGG